MSFSEQELLEFQAEALELLELAERSLLSLDQGGDFRPAFDCVFRSFHNLKGASGMMNLLALQILTHELENILIEFKDATAIPHDYISLFLKGIDAARSILKGVEVTFDFSIVSHSSKLEVYPAPVIATRPAESKGEDSSVRVSVLLLDNLMTLMEEMILVRNQMMQLANKSEDLEFLNLSKRLYVVSSEIHSEMIKTRMQPIGYILSKFNRVVRDLSRELKKEINLNFFGAETELDKILLESIKDPLTHIVRNSCDHGIETPVDRVKAGKSGTGTINIRSYHEDDHLVIEVSDDGKGLHKEVLLKKGIEKGIITQRQASNMSEKEIFNLIFSPGFSTAVSVTNVSGRGVGMDVVRNNVERIGGSVDLNSVLGKGTTIKIKIPLNLVAIAA